jgi:hypothetical protein
VKRAKLVFATALITSMALQGNAAGSFADSEPTASSKITLRSLTSAPSAIASGAQGIIASGARSQGIIASGAQGIIASGARSQGIIASGAQGIIASGASAN